MRRANPETYQLAAGLLAGGFYLWFAGVRSFSDAFGLLWCSLVAGVAVYLIQQIQQRSKK